MFKKNQSFLFFSFGIFLILSLLGIIWIRQLPSTEEAVGVASILHDFFFRSFGGVAALWNPHFLLGYHQLLYLIKGVPYFFEGGMVALLSPLLGELGALKLAALIYFFLAILAMYHMIMVLLHDRWVAFVGGVFYLLMPAMVMRGVIYEHFGCLLCFVFIPLLMAMLWQVGQSPELGKIVLLGVLGALLFFTYTKVAIMVAPMLLLWSGWIVSQRLAAWRSILAAYGGSILVFLLLVIPFLLPLLREYQGTARFLLDPFAQWQDHYSLKSFLEVLDTWGIALRGSGSQIEHDHKMFATGLLPMILLSLGVGLSSLTHWRKSETGKLFLILVACWLLSLGLAAGPLSLLKGHFQLLKLFAHTPDWSTVLLWGSLVWLVWLVYKTLAGILGERGWIIWGGVAIFMGVPFFRILEIIPLFKDIRAPETFISIGGFVVLVAAVAIAALALLRVVVPQRYHMATAVLVALLMIVEGYPIDNNFWSHGVTQEKWADYEQLLHFLKEAPLPGRVASFSADYFFLALPGKIGRELNTEAAFRHFQTLGARWMDVYGQRELKNLSTYFSFSGVSYIVIDTTVYSLSMPLVKQVAQTYPLVFRNTHYLVFANQQALYPAFLAHNFVVFPVKGYVFAPLMYSAMQMRLLPIERKSADIQEPGFSGFLNNNHQLQLMRDFSKNGADPFQVVRPLSHQDHQLDWDFQFQGGESGWLVLNQAFHPDWKVSIDGTEQSVVRAGIGLMGVNLPTGAKKVHFYFQPPFWYPISVAFGLFFWIALLGMIGYLQMPSSLPRWRKLWGEKITELSLFKKYF